VQRAIATKGPLSNSRQNRALDAASSRQIRKGSTDLVRRRCRKFESSWERKKLEDWRAIGIRNSVAVPGTARTARAETSGLVGRDQQVRWDRALCDDAAGIGDWRSGSMSIIFQVLSARAGGRLSRLRSLCPACRSKGGSIRVTSEDHQDAEARSVGGALGADRRRSACPDCTRCGRRWFGYALVPEWNTHKPGGSGRLHANCSANRVGRVHAHRALRDSWSRRFDGSRMVEVVNISHALKALSGRELEARTVGRHAPDDV